MISINHMSRLHQRILNMYKNVCQLICRNFVLLSFSNIVQETDRFHKYLSPTYYEITRCNKNWHATSVSAFHEISFSRTLFGKCVKCERLGAAGFLTKTNFRMTVAVEMHLAGVVSNVPDLDPAIWLLTTLGYFSELKGVTCELRVRCSRSKIDRK